MFQNEQIPYNSSRPIVTAMDPDAPLRQNKPLHDIDMVSFVISTIRNDNKLFCLICVIWH